MQPHQRTSDYRFTLPVKLGIIQDDGSLAKLRYRAAFDNGVMYGWRMAKNSERVSSSKAGSAGFDDVEDKGYQLRYVIALQWRGPRYGRSHTTLREHARAVDVYVRLRRDYNHWNSRSSIRTNVSAATCRIP